MKIIGKLRPLPHPHTHVDEHGMIVKCYHKSKAILLSGSFWFGVTVSYPLEHFLWEQVWPFKLLTALMSGGH